MGAVNTSHVLWLLLVAAVVYAVWMVWYLTRESRRTAGAGKKGASAADSSGSKKRKRDIVGKSRFVLPSRSHSQPLTATASENENRTENPDIFAPASVPEHPRQIPPDELDEVFGMVPEGETNEPLDIELPPDSEIFPDDDADYFNDGDDENEDLPFRGKQSAQGFSFDQLGDAYRRVVHNPTITDDEKEETGCVLLNLQGTDMLGAMVAGKPERDDKVKSLIDTYLTAFHKRNAERSAESLSPQGAVPTGFDIRRYV
ncbi:hypothetical protein [Sunxiuqinia elliptica]|jgi:hypothetical protein|uniref:Uncharacterized protein n=1 Tax=Sunxiuqinia elliptica TaxID=655355 RepID=A0A4R6H8S6_9BACT|nr:hypothetical protein [Sunxiuqinia elliptica]TDO04833.1 hypothetical protein DET52_101184 [Sunxiuqinia elliptica]TDO64381.1 hypothetical protein DET65_0741 [Sunxiuqinia elliptica]